MHYIKRQYHVWYTIMFLIEYRIWNNQVFCIANSSRIDQKGPIHKKRNQSKHTPSTKTTKYRLSSAHVAAEAAVELSIFELSLWGLSKLRLAAKFHAPLFAEFRIWVSGLGCVVLILSGWGEITFVFCNNHSNHTRNPSQSCLTTLCWT